MDRCGQRNRLAQSFLVCLVLFVFGHVNASEEVCRTGCKGGAAHSFKYAVGTTYKYSYDGKIEISLSSAEGQVTGTEVKADVLLTQLGDCNQVIRLQNVQVIGSNGKKVGSIPDIEKPIRINNNDGVLADGICVVEGDNQNSINVKRAIASFFQASLKTGYETDVFGTCATDSSSHKEGDILVVTKARNLNKCAHRENIQQDFLATAFNLNSEIKSSPLLNGEYNANLRVKNGILEQATITEDYLYIPFSVGKNGAKAKVVSKLQLTGTSGDNAPAPVTKPKSIIFDNPHPVNAPTSNAQTILQAVKDVSQTVDVVVGETTANKFVTLLKIVKVSKKSDLLAVYNQVKSGIGIGDKDSAKRLYLDALLRSGNGDSIEAILELLKQKELGETDSKIALLGLSFVRHATVGAVEAAVHLLETPKLPRETYLGIGNIAGRFCRLHSCDDVPAIKTLTNKFLAKIGAKPTNREQENEIVFALKGLANFHHLNDNILQKLSALAQNKDVPNRIKVAALETFLADPCKDKLRNTALNILKDIQQDSEVRIKAYLVVAQCPNAKIGNAVKAILEKEPSIQVGGFITSHIRSIRFSANPDKALAKQHLGFSPRKRFPIDPRKYSFNGEFSYAVDTLGLASSAEANVIYSQNSWLPRSSSVNLTAEVFGHNFNFLELETRQENLDRLVEHYFGPKGLLRSSPIKELIGKGKNSFKHIAEYVNKKLIETVRRSRRDVSKAEIDHMAKQVQIKTNELNKDLDLDLSVKAFGAEVLFLNLNRETEKITPESIIDEVMSHLSEGLDKLKRFEETLRRNLLFLDAELDYPTSMGFPLRLAVEGSATIQVKTEGSIDIRKILNSPENGNLKIKLIPSANIEVSGRLTLDALVVENGLKTVSTLYSSTGSDVTVSWDRSTGFDLKLGLPVKEQKLINANHEIVFTTREQSGREHNLPLKFTQVKDFSICLDQLSPFIGLTFCAEINGPNLGGQQIPVLPFPFSGDAKVAVTIENDDVSEYRLQQKLKGNPPTHSELIWETIGKNGQRKVALDLIAEYDPERYVKAIFSSAAKSASAEARLVSTNVEKSFLLKITNDKDEYIGKVGVSISGTPERAVYKPLLEYKTPAGEQPLPFKAEGQIVVEHNGENLKYIFENVRLTDQQRTFSLNGNLGRENGVFFADLKMSDGHNSISFEERLQLTPELIKYNIKVQNTFNNNANFNLKGEFKRQPNEYDTAIQLIHGPDLNTKTSILTITSKLVNKFKNPQDYRFETKTSIKYPLLSLSGKFELEDTPKSLDYEIEAVYGDLKLGSELEVKINEKNVGDYEVEFDVWGFDNKLEVKSRRTVLPNDESKISNTLEINGKKFEVEGKIRHLLRPSNVDLNADVTVHIPTHANPLKVGLGLKITVEEFDAYQKISSGSDTIIDAFLKANKNGNANGSIKMNIKNVVVINGQIHASNGAGNGDILIDLQKGKRQIKGDTNFNVQVGKSYSITASLYPSFNKDKNLKLSVSTNTQVSETSIDTKNKIDILGHPLEVNLKGSKTGDDKTGKIDGEVDVTFPDDQYVMVKVNCDHKEAENLMNGQAQGVAEFRKNKNTPGRKISYKSSWRNTNPEEAIFDIDATISADDINGENINTDISLKKTNQAGTHDFKYNHKIYGNLLWNPYELGVEAQCKEDLNAHYDIKSSYGPTNTLHIQGGHDSSEEKRSGSFSLQLATERTKLKTVNIDLRGSVAGRPNEHHPVQLEGSANVYAAGGESHPEPFVDVKAQGSAKVGLNKGELQGALTLSKIEPITASASYNVKENRQGGSGSVTVTYGTSRTYKLDSALQRVAEHHYKLTAAAQTPMEGYKNSQLSVETKRSDDNKNVNSDVELTVDGKNWKLNTALVLSDLVPSVNIKITDPEGKLSEIYAKGNKVSDKQFSGELKLVNEPKNFLLDGAITFNVANLDNLIIKGQVNSPNLNLDKIVFEANNKGASNDRKIQILVKSANKNLISGSTSYSAKEENGKFIVEGSGNFKVKDETKSGNFKYILQRLESGKNGETGTEVSFDAVLGDQAIDSEFKMTNKHFRFQNSYCEQKKECAYVEIDNKINSNDIKNFNQVLEINLDLRKLGLSHEFGLKSVTSRKEWIIDHTVDVHFQNQENSKYLYSFYIHPEESSLSLTTPKRIIALESKFSLPKNVKEGGKAHGEVAFYMDKKNHANRKAALSWSLDVDLKGTIQGQTKLTHPGLKKPLVVSVKAIREGTPYNGKVKVVSEFDIFAQDNQKIIATFQKSVSLDDAKAKGGVKHSLAIQSKGLDIDILASEVMSVDRVKKESSYEQSINYHVGKSKYENLVSGKVTPDGLTAAIKVLNRELLRVVYKLQYNDHEQIFETEVSSYDNNPIVTKLEIKNYNTLAYSAGYKKTPNNKLLFNAGLIPGQIADVRSDYLEGGAKTNLFFATIKLDDADFLKSDHKVDSQAIHRVLGNAKTHENEFYKGLQELIKEWAQNAKAEAQHVGELGKKALPNLQPLRQYYTKEIQAIQNEILNDKSIKELSQALSKVLGELVKAVSEITDRISQLAEETAHILNNSFNSVIETIDKDLIPHLQQIATRLLNLTKGISDLILDIVLGGIAKASQILEQYQPELKELTVIFEELGQDIGKVIISAYTQARENVRAILARVQAEIKASPFIDELKAQYEALIKEGIPSADAIVNTIREVFNTIRDLIPAEFVIREDISNLMDTITNYVEKKLKNQPVDDIAVFQQIAQNIQVIVKKMMSIVSAEGYDLPGVNKVDSGFLFPLSHIANLPNLVAIKFSPVGYLMDQHLPGDIVRFLLSLVDTPRNLRPPFPKYGMIIQGQHIFTFDGKHITFPGTCNYLLAADAVNNNFTLAGSYKNGLLASITLADQTNSVTLIQGGKVKLNNANVELPARKPELAAYRDYEMIHLVSTAGVHVSCTPNLIGCSVLISGFYHGQLKGLLGNGNNEPYDDLTIPNGKIVTAEGEFVNSYKMSSGCADVNVPKHDQIPDNSVCNKLFSWDTDFSICFPFVPTENFKAACSLGLAAKVAGTEEAVAKAYVAACQNRGIPVHVPESLLKCINGDKPYSVGDTFSVKLPSKAADIVLIVDTDKTNKPLYEKLVQQLVPEIGRELNSKGINDVEFHLITYGGPNQWPSHVTVNGKLTFKGKPPALQFGEEPEDEYNIKEIENPSVQRLVENLKETLHDLSLATGMNLKARTYDEAHKYPFRVHALKSIIVVNSQQCEIGKLYHLQKLGALFYSNPQVSLNLFTPFDSLSLKNSKKTKDIVGFNLQRVFTLSQGKKNPKGTAELHKELNYEDYCVDFSIKNRGNAFSNNNFLSLGDADQKQYVNIAASNIIDQMINLEQGLDCECSVVNPYNARNVCHESYSKERLTKKV